MRWGAAPPGEPPRDPLKDGLPDPEAGANPPPQPPRRVAARTAVLFGPRVFLESSACEHCVGAHSDVSSQLGP